MSSPRIQSVEYQAYKQAIEVLSDLEEREVIVEFELVLLTTVGWVVELRWAGLDDIIHGEPEKSYRLQPVSNHAMVRMHYRITDDGKTVRIRLGSGAGKIHELLLDGELVELPRIGGCRAFSSESDARAFAEALEHVDTGLSISFTRPLREQKVVEQELEEIRRQMPSAKQRFLEQLDVYEAARKARKYTPLPSTGH